MTVPPPNWPFPTWKSQPIKPTVPQTDEPLF